MLTSNGLSDLNISYVLADWGRQLIFLPLLFLISFDDDNVNVLIKNWTQLYKEMISTKKVKAKLTKLIMRENPSLSCIEMGVLKNLPLTYPVA